MAVASPSIYRGNLSSRLVLPLLCPFILHLGEHLIAAVALLFLCENLFYFWRTVGFFWKVSSFQDWDALHKRCTGRCTGPLPPQDHKSEAVCHPISDYVGCLTDSSGSYWRLFCLDNEATV